jgi:hypothetical protein
MHTSDSILYFFFSFVLLSLYTIEPRSRTESVKARKEVQSFSAGAGVGGKEDI